MFFIFYFSYIAEKLNIKLVHYQIINTCYQSKSWGESVNHLLLHCPIAYELWSMVFVFFGIHWVMPYKVSELLASWPGKFGRHRNIDLCRFGPQCLFWCLWPERNARYFEDCERSILYIKSFFFQSHLDWSVVLPFYSSFFLSNLIHRFNLGSWFVPL